VKELLGRAKVYVHSAHNEHFGITIVEAMAAGCVPVVNDTGGPREIVSADVGYRWNDVNQAVVQVSNLIEDEALRRELSKAAASRAREFGPEAFESGMRRVFQEYA
jgi:glycosyltransferase involved in cell wall biosynthesis